MATESERILVIREEYSRGRGILAQVRTMEELSRAGNRDGLLDFVHTIVPEFQHCRQDGFEEPAQDAVLASAAARRSREHPTLEAGYRRTEIEYVTRMLRSGNLSMGPLVAEFEERFAAYAGTRFAVATNSGTSALHLCVKALDIGATDEVVTTSFSFVASANCLLYERALPAFADIDPGTLNLDPERNQESSRANTFTTAQRTPHKSVDGPRFEGDSSRSYFRSSVRHGRRSWKSRGIQSWRFLKTLARRSGPRIAARPWGTLETRRFSPFTRISK